MIHIIWEFQVEPSQVDEFERNYSQQGAWARLFSKSENYHGTLLLKDSNASGRYLTIDRWNSLADFEDFKAQHLKAYDDLDRVCEILTLAEKKMGVFEVL